MADNTISISVKGTETKLKFDDRTAKLFPYNLSAILKQYPDNFTEYSALFRSPTLAYCGYYIQCHDTNTPADIPFDDFCQWAAESRQTIQGKQLLNQINELYQKHAEA